MDYVNVYKSMKECEKLSNDAYLAMDIEKHYSYLKAAITYEKALYAGFKEFYPDMTDAPEKNSANNIELAKSIVDHCIRKDWYAVEIRFDVNQNLWFVNIKNRGGAIQHFDKDVVIATIMAVQEIKTKENSYRPDIERYA